jgi:hypothetical protein
MTVSRREWSGSYPAGQGTIQIFPIYAFNWLVYRHVMPSGTKLITTSSKVIERAKAPNITLTVRGRGTVRGEDGTVYPDRVPGLFSPERTDVPKGAVTTLADSELEFWCFNWTANRGALPQVEALRITEDENVIFPSGQRVLVCLGKVGNFSAGESFTADGTSMSVTAPTYGFLIGDSRA